ncbi:nicotinamide riboside transporter PnuC [Thermophagus xiamenensis]|uniref:Nicotinamide riboside transporter PnuC n=1 Tax=Thermophagus xiamenensis TaxID=385682 RepID=A0A1I2DAC7_9BACT|nr:nicotinamide riboside transporter PnuC [Thermophagus xiamenensis]SFE76940.1 nicotinamide mononucleotide transporter [Thermophagus xiamenensis]
MTQWLLQHWMELTGTVLSLIYLYFSVRENIWLWVTGFFSSLFYLIIFFHERLYADMGLQVYYLIISIYGWIVWTMGRQRSGRKKMPIRKTGIRKGLILLIAGGGIYLIVLLILLKLPAKIDIPASDLPYWDAFTTTGGIVATWMLAKKYLEHWLIWIIVDAVSSGMYLYKGLNITVLLYLVYTVVAVVGYYEWRQSMIKGEKL